ncbi:MAG: L-threonylcarbamoyladenylate synthase, partial [Phycisphaerales bacterium]|nr:L-threonylcarbamoyladenylate synthase [Phycisphaerales bacterium]
MPVVSATQRAILEAARSLEGGGVVSFPTETVYGLGGDTLNKKAIQKIYSLKNRPSNNPLIAHVLNSSWAKQITCGWDEKCHLLAERFWPGPLTIVLPKANCVPKESCGGHNTIGVRSPNHRVASELLDKFGGPISAPSANKSGQTSPTSAEHVRDDFGNDLLILDGGNCDQGIESTVLSMVDCPTIL